jgi:hypothetical protein
LGGGAQAALAAESLEIGTIPVSVAGGHAFEFTANGRTSQLGEVLYIFLQPIGEACATTVEGDHGTLYLEGASLEEGTFSFTSLPVSIIHGSYRLCGYVILGSLGAASAPLSTVSQLFTVANGDSLTLSAEQNPGIQGQQNAIDFAGYADGPVEIYVAFKAAGGACARNASAEPGAAPINLGIVNSEINAATQTPRLSPGGYLVCAWLQPAGNPGGEPFATGSLLLTVSPYRASVSQSAPAQVPYGASVTVGVDYSANTASELFMFVPITETTCAASVNAIRGLGFNPLFEPRTESRSRSIPANRLSGHLDVTVPPPLRAGAFTVCAWLAAGTVEAGPFSTKFTTLAPGQLPAPPRGHGRAYRGRTSQRLPIVLTYGRGRISNLAYQALYTCTGFHPRVRERTEVGQFRVGRHGKFLHRWSKGSDRGTIQGRFSRQKLTGTFTETYRSQAGSTCRTGSVAFRARAH